MSNSFLSSFSTTTSENKVSSSFDSMYADFAYAIKHMEEKKEMGMKIYTKRNGEQIIEVYFDKTARLRFGANDETVQGCMNYIAKGTVMANDIDITPKMLENGEDDYSTIIVNDALDKNVEINLCPSAYSKVGNVIGYIREPKGYGWFKFATKNEELKEKFTENGYLL